MVFYGIGGSSVVYNGGIVRARSFEPYQFKYGASLGASANSYPVSASSYDRDGNFIASGTSTAISGSTLSIPFGGSWKVEQKKAPYKIPSLSTYGVNLMSTGIADMNTFTGSGKSVPGKTQCSFNVTAFDDNVYNLTSNMYWSLLWNNVHKGVTSDYIVYFSFENTSVSSMPSYLYSALPTWLAPDAYYSARRNAPVLSMWNDISISADATKLKCLSARAMYHMYVVNGTGHEMFTKGGSGTDSSAPVAGYWYGSYGGMTGFSAWGYRSGHFTQSATSIKLSVSSYDDAEQDSKMRVTSSMPIGKWYFSGIAR